MALNSLSILLPPLFPPQPLPVLPLPRHLPPPPPSLLASPLLPPSESELEKFLLACSAVKNMTSLSCWTHKKNKQKPTKDSRLWRCQSVRGKQDSGRHLPQAWSKLVVFIVVHIRTCNIIFCFPSWVMCVCTYCTCTGVVLSFNFLVLL